MSMHKRRHSEGEATTHRYGKKLRQSAPDSPELADVVEGTLPGEERHEKISQDCDGDIIEGSPSQNDQGDTTEQTQTSKEAELEIEPDPDYTSDVSTADYNANNCGTMEDQLLSMIRAGTISFTVKMIWGSTTSEAKSG